MLRTPYVTAVVSVTSLLVSGCAQRSPDGHSEEYAVYRAVLQSFYDGIPEQLVVVDSTTLWAVSDSTTGHFVRDLLAGVSPKLVTRFLELNGQSVPLYDGFDLQAQVRLVQYDTLKAAFERAAKLRLPDPWDQFYERYPEARGFEMFSQVAYTEDRDSSLVSFDHSCGWTCYVCLFVVMERSDSAWAVTSTYQCGVA
jgi:hypothetical protein